MAYECEIIADSKSPRGVRLTTLSITLPRIILPELNTHRIFSRNSASSRAIPIAMRIAAAMNDPFVPKKWGKNQAGMQAKEYLNAEDSAKATAIWLAARDDAVKHTKALDALGVHKQHANRLLEPFLWQTVLVTATEWSNFYALRKHKDAQDEIREAAELMFETFQGSEPKLIKKGEWHLPFIQPEEFDGKFEHTELARKVSVGRCARVSYKLYDGSTSLEADLALCETLIASGHMSPLEHVATPSMLPYLPVSFTPDASNFKGWKQYRKFIPHENDYAKKLVEIERLKVEAEAVAMTTAIHERIADNKARAELKVLN